MLISQPACEIRTKNDATFLFLSLHLSGFYYPFRTIKHNVIEAPLIYTKPHTGSGRSLSESNFIYNAECFIVSQYLNFERAKWMTAGWSGSRES